MWRDFTIIAVFAGSAINVWVFLNGWNPLNLAASVFTFGIGIALSLKTYQ